MSTTTKGGHEEDRAGSGGAACNDEVRLTGYLSEPAATSWNSGFQMWVRLASTRVIRACPLRPNRFPKRVASSKPPAPPPTITIC